MASQSNNCSRTTCNLIKTSQSSNYKPVPTFICISICILSYYFAFSENHDISLEEILARKGLPTN
jgi:hypothetical protein